MTATTRFSSRHAERDFTKATLSALAKRGIILQGSTLAPAALMSDGLDMARAAVVYEINDRGTYRVRSHAEVLAMATA